MVGIGGTNYGRLRQRQGTPSGLSTADPVPSFGEFISTYDGTDPVLKMGDGVRSWSELPNLVGGGGGYEVRKTVFRATSIPRDPVDGQVPSASIVWDEVEWWDNTGQLGAAPDWGGRASGDLFLTAEVGGAGYYRFYVAFSFGLPEADAFEGARLRIARDAFDPLPHAFTTEPHDGGFAGVAGSWSTPPVWVDTDDGARLAISIINDPLTGVGAAFAPSSSAVAMLEVTMERLT